MGEHQMVQVKHIMTADVVTVGKNTPISEVTELLMKNNITGMPVVEEDMTLVGVVTEKDVLRLFYASGDAQNRTVSDFMTTPAIYFDENENLRDVCNCLMDNFFRRVPVTSHGKVIGIVSRRDMLAYMSEVEHDEDAGQEPSELTSAGAAG
jgi:CBS domain-containing protein